MQQVARQHTEAKTMPVTSDRNVLPVDRNPPAKNPICQPFCGHTFSLLRGQLLRDWSAGCCPAEQADHDRHKGGLLPSMAKHWRAWYWAATVLQLHVFARMARPVAVSACCRYPLPPFPAETVCPGDSTAGNADIGLGAFGAH